MSRRGARALTFALSTLLLAGCLTGKRPHFEDEPFPAGSLTGDAAVDAVLTKFDQVTTGPATGAYDILTKSGVVHHPAVVVLEPGRRSITIDNHHYIQTESLAKTCTTDASAPCSEGFDLQPISNVGVTIDFYAGDAAKRLRRDFQAMIGPATPHNETFAQQPASCVDVPLPGGTAVYCALDNGMVAKLDDGDVLVSLTMFVTTTDPAQFVPPA